MNEELQSGEIISDSFDYEGYQVVRREFFAHLSEPSITFNRYKIYVNTTCLRKAPETEFVQIMVNTQEQKMVIRPCQEDEKDSFSWCTARRKPRAITCRVFFAKTMDFMNWIPGYRYKLIGKKIISGGEQLFVFDLSAVEMFPHQSKTLHVDAFSPVHPIYPEEWKNQFGLPVKEHKKVFQVNLFDKFAVFSVKSDPNASLISGNSVGIEKG